nr:hypothetical protein BHI3_00370 [Bacteriovorax sp. HI3]
MKTLFILSSLLLFTACSTYVPVEYRSAGEFALAKGTVVKVVYPETNSFVKSLEKSIAEDGWLKLASASDKKFYELSFEGIKRDSRESYSSTSERDGKKYRTVSMIAEGSGVLIVKSSDKKVEKTFSFSGRGDASSEKEMPKDPGAKSLRPIFNMLLGHDEKAEAMNSQNTYATMEAMDNLNINLAKEVLKKITPAPKLVSLKIEDDEDDMEALEKFIDNKEYDSAFHYLSGLLEKGPRSDIYYNLGIIQEARQNYTDNCVNYQKAYDLSSKASYLQQKAACLSRQGELAKIQLLN